MTVTTASFRQFLPAFSSSESFPDSAIQSWLGIALLMLPTNRWGIPSVNPDQPPTSKIDYATCFFAAHHLILELQANKAAERGAMPGTTTGVISANSVGPVSRSYDNSKTLDMDAGHWNATIYGMRFYALAQMAGMGPVTIGGGGCGGVGGFGEGPYNGGAWSGPPWWPGWFG